jgi:RNA polymerase sigma factor (sigma-70 family)
VSGTGSSETLSGVGDELRGQGDGLLLSSGAAGLGVLYDRHARAVFRLALTVVSGPDDADEVVQETFLVAWRKRRAVTLVNDSALPWLLTTARLEALSLRRRTNRRDALHVPLVPEIHDRQTDGPETSLSDLLDGVSAADRAVLQAVLVDGLSYAEAAAALGVTVTTVGKRLQRARQRVRGLLGGARALPGEGTC